MRFFSVFSFDGVLAGCGVNAEYFQARRAHVDEGWPVRTAVKRALAGRAIGQREAIGGAGAGGSAIFCGGGSRWRRVWC